MARTSLFTPAQMGAITLKHRVVMPPLSRLSAQWPSGVPSALNLEYYSSAPRTGADLHRGDGDLPDRSRLQGRAWNLQ